MECACSSQKTFLYVYLTFLLLASRLLRVRPIAKALEACVTHAGVIAGAQDATLGSRRPVVKKSLLVDDERNVHYGRYAHRMAGVARRCGTRH